MCVYFVYIYDAMHAGWLESPKLSLNYGLHLVRTKQLHFMMGFTLLKFDYLCNKHMVLVLVLSLSLPPSLYLLTHTEKEKDSEGG